ncbi:MAG: S1C family serine protease, partial [Acidobacteriota bacterium]
MIKIVCLGVALAVPAVLPVRQVVALAGEPTSSDRGGQQTGSGPGAAIPSRPEPGVWGFVGVYLGDTTAEQARRLGLGEIYGVIVGTVEKGSPAAVAGLQSGDCLLSLDGEKILNRLQFFQIMMNTPPGKRIRLGLLRTGERLEVELEVGKRLSQALLQRRRLFSEPDSMVRLADENRRLADEARAKGDEKGAARFSEAEVTLRQMADDSRAYIENELREGRISEPVAVQNF